MAHSRKDQSGGHPKHAIGRGGKGRVDQHGRYSAAFGAEAWTPRGRRFAKKQASRARRRVPLEIE